MTSYDSNLLASAPAATKAQLQEGYATDLLEKPAASAASHSRQNLAEAGSPDGPDVEQLQPSPPPKTPFYRTKKGIIIIAVIALVVIIAAAVGGGVAGSHKKKNATSASPQVGDQGALPPASTQGGAQVPSSSPALTTTGGSQQTVTPVFPSIPSVSVQTTSSVKG